MESEMSSKSKKHRSRTNEVLAVILIAFSVLLILSLVTYDPKDPSWNSVGPQQRSSNLIGVFGAYLADFLLSMFGLASLSIPVLLVVIAVRVFFAEEVGVTIKKAIAAILLLTSTAGTFA